MTKFKIYRALVFILFIIFPGISFASPITIIGIPTEKVQSESGYTEYFNLNKTQGTQNQCVITKAGNTYYWTSRNNVQMQHHKSGIYDTYSATKGQGYVKIENGKQYIEHTHIGLKTITYWGKILR